jgi:hypothetical protein
MDKESPPRAFGVFKPIGHVVVSFPPQIDLEKVRAALADAGVPRDDATRYTAGEMKRQIDEDLHQGGVLASIGQEMNLVKAHRELAEEGYGWLVVKATSDEHAREIAAITAGFGAERAQHYGRFVIEELIDHGDDPVQSPESPDMGLDAETPSGDEKERTVLPRDQTDTDSR